MATSLRDHKDLWSTTAQTKFYEPGTRGGDNTLHKLSALARDMMEQDDQSCLIWLGALTSSTRPGMGSPVARLDGKQIMVRRYVYKVARGNLESRSIPYPTCGTVGCISPAHLKLMSRSEISQLTVGRK